MNGYLLLIRVNAPLLNKHKRNTKSNQNVWILHVEWVCNDWMSFDEDILLNFLFVINLWDSFTNWTLLFMIPASELATIDKIILALFKAWKIFKHVHKSYVWQVSCNK